MRSFVEPAALACGWRGRGVAWLDGDGSEPQGRWSFVGCDPVEIREARFGDPEPLAMLRTMACLEPSEARALDGAPEPALVPAWIGFVAYDAAWSMARAIGLRASPRIARTSTLPIARFARYDALIAIDRGAQRAWLVGDDEAAIARMRARLSSLSLTAPSARAGEVVAEDPAAHREAIGRALEAIAAGEIYQVNLARAWRARFEGDAIALFLAMRDASPVPFGAYVEGASWAVLARTMERFLRFDARDRSISTRPIKGTIARAGDDDALEAETLRADAKERAEHAMIVDLMRNDLGRVAEVGTMRIEDVMQVEPYAGLSHLVSTVRATVREGVQLEDILAATFPPGSITGAPKLRAMEIIEALERDARGVYCGAIGHVDRAGGLSLAVAIRTATIEEGELTYSAGGGLVEASRIEREIEETELKARVLVDALATLEHAAPDSRAKRPSRFSGVV